MNPLTKIIFFFYCLIFSLSVKGQYGSHASMGDASVMLSDFWSVFSNQAGIAIIENPTVGIAYYNQFLVRETGTQLGAIVMPTRTGNFAASYKRFGYSLYSENNVGLAYARNLGKLIAASVQFNYLFYNQADDYGNRGAFLVEVGFIATLTEQFFIGTHLYNPTRVKLADYQDERVPTVLRFGTGYYFSQWVLFTLETEKELEEKARFKAGLAYEPLPSLFLRTGLLTQPNQFTLGVGYRIKNLNTDISFVTHESLPVSSQLAITYKF